MVRLLLSLIILLGFQKTWAQWTQASNGLYGGHVYSMVSINENIFAGTNGSVFMSKDNAVSWTSVNAGLSGNFVNSLIAEGNNLFVATNGGGTYYSSDNGTTWTSINFATNNSMIRLAAIGTTVYAFSNIGALYSIPNGSNTGTLISTGLSNPFSFEATGTKLLIGTQSGMYSSVDAGVTWTAVNTGYPTSIYGSLSSSGAAIVAGLNSSLLVSTNSGVTWINTGLAYGSFPCIAIASNKIWVGSSNGANVSVGNGVSWNTVTGLPAMMGLASNSSGLYAGTSTGVYRSVDGGSTWSFSSTGLTNAIIQALIVGGNNLYASNGNKVYVSSDRGGSWSDLHAIIPDGINVRSLAVSGSNLLVGTNTGVYLTQNNGTSWSLVNGLGSASRFAILGTDLFAGNASGVYVSHNNGVSWTFFASTSATYGMAAMGNYLYVGSTLGVIRYTPTGLGSVLGTGLPLTSGQPISTFSNIGDQLFSGMPNYGVFTSIDGGVTWTAVNNGFTSSLIVNALAANGDNLYSSRTGTGIYVTANKGTFWTSFNSGIPPYVWNSLNEIPTLVVLGNKLFAGTATAGVWSTCIGPSQPAITASGLNTLNPVLTSSSSGGNHWFLNGSPITGSVGSAPTLTATESGSYTVQVTSADGCTSPPSSAQAIVITGDVTTYLAGEIEVFPNPASNGMTIGLTKLPVNQRVEIDIFDIVGRHITTM